MYLDDIDKKQNAYDTMRLNAEEGGIRLANRMDARFLYQVRNATVSCDDGEEVAVIKLGHLLGNLVKSLILIPQTV